MVIQRTLRAATLIGVVGILTACQPKIPDSGAGQTGRGFGFNRKTSTAPQTIQKIRPQSLPANNQQNQRVETVSAASKPRILPDVSQKPGALSRGPRTSIMDGREVVNASPSNPMPVAVNNSSLSDENDFGAVSSRQSIESDKARLKANREQYALVQPTALPDRNEESQPNIVAYALKTKHARGTKVYRRFGLAGAGKTARNCASYSTWDDAQTDFLKRGGPTKDRHALDPDGDGYACDWDPSKYRR